jgi:CRISPR-associated protein Cas4
MGGEVDLVHATPQKQGKAAHEAIDEKKYSSRKDEITALSVYCEELKIMGKIDLYKQKEKLLIERKYKLETIYQGQIYQLWAQFFCMLEMGYDIEKLAFYSISTNKMFPIEIPAECQKQELILFIEKMKEYDPNRPINVNNNKCKHCIYCNLCDKTEFENVYS